MNEDLHHSMVCGTGAGERQFGAYNGARSTKLVDTPGNTKKQSAG